MRLIVRVSILLVLLLHGLPGLWAQLRPPEVVRGVQQCAAIRNLLYEASEKQLTTLIAEEGRGSRGYQTYGTWQFETVQFSSILNWEGASRTYIDHSEERTDSTYTLYRQFVAEYAPLPTAEEGRRFFDLLNTQIGDCKVFLKDTQLLLLQPVPLHKIQDELPVAALDARLYPVQVPEEREAQNNQQVNIMTAYERRGRSYSAYMIVEYRLHQRLSAQRPVQ